MRQRAFKHVSHDFHVAVRVSWKTAASGDPVVIHHPQRAEMDMLRVVVIGKGKRKVGIEPAMVGVPAFVALANVDHCCLLDWPSLRQADNTRYNDYCQAVHLIPALRF